MPFNNGFVVLVSLHVLGSVDEHPPDDCSRLVRYEFRVQGSEFRVTGFGGSRIALRLPGMTDK